jgi:RNA polymerase sigma-70 factor (ECF subfamily)
MNEKDLIIKLKQSSQKAFDEIYRLYAARLYAYCYQYTKSREDTEEIVQDVFTRLWINRMSVVQEETVSSLLFTIAKNQLINIYRQRLNSPVFEEYINCCNQEKFSIEDTRQKIEYDDFCRQLNKLVKRLPETQRKVFDCCIIQQLSNKETAEKLSLKEQTIKNQLSSALKILRNELGKIWVWLITLLIVK